MAASCPRGFDIARLRKQISQTYDRLAREPNGNFHFHRGPAYASHMLRYNRDELAAIPAECTASFSGVGNPHRIGAVEPGETILDIGCGAGMDLLLAAKRTGAMGRAIGVDMTPAMIERAKAAALKTGLWKTVEIRRGIAEELPIETDTIDVVISNGVLNLSADKVRAFACCARAAASIWPMLLCSESYLSARAAMSISGPPESAGLCRRQSFTNYLLRLVSPTARSSSDSIVTKARRPKQNYRKIFTYRE
jgi:SAM-dependent methyltransferase